MSAVSFVVEWGSGGCRHLVTVAVPKTTEEHLVNVFLFGWPNCVVGTTASGLGFACL